MTCTNVDNPEKIVIVTAADPSRRGKRPEMWLRSAQDGRANAGQEAVRRGFLTTRPSLRAPCAAARGEQLPAENMYA